MTDTPPDPVPPRGKPRIGMVWIVVVLAIGLVFGAWIYASAKRPDADAPRPVTPQQRTVP